MDTSEEEIENVTDVTDESGNRYMIQRIPVDNGQLLSTEILQTSGGLVVDLGGDFIPVNAVNYNSEDLLSHDVTEEDRNLAAALVAVQFNQQQKQQQSQQDGVILDTSALPSLMTALEGSKGKLGEQQQQVLLQDKETGFIQIVDAEDLYKQGFKYDERSQTLQLIKPTEVDVAESSNELRVTKKSLPHKKRIAKKLKKSERHNQSRLQTCTFCEEIFRSDEIDNHQAMCQTNITTTVANAFACQICTCSFEDQLEFFEHLKKHYEPVAQALRTREVDLEDKIPTQITILKGEDHEIIKIDNSNPPLLSSILTLTCIHCNKTFRRQKAYDAHVRDAHSDVIQEEDNEFSEPEDLMAGIAVNSPGEIEEDNKEWYRDDELQATEEDLKELEANEHEHVCQNCTLSFAERGAMLQHLLTCQGIGIESESPKPKPITIKKRGKKGKADLECDICQRKFAHKNSLVYHMRSHTEDRPYQCEQCGKSFFAASALKVHMRLHSGEKPYRCEFCGRHFRQWGDLKYHCISIHSDEKQYQCEYCGKEFARKYSLIVHRRIHTGEKNYRCEFCGKTFRASSYLQNHRRIHTGEKPHPCDVCGKCFRVRSDMKRHLRTHSKRRPGRLNVNVELEMPIPMLEEVMKEEPDTDMPQESEDTNESITLLKQEESEAAVQSLQYEGDAVLESIRDANTLYVQMPILIS